MANAKQQVHLNGAYYGPPVPPPSNSYRSMGRSSSVCCGPCCLISALIKFVVSVVLIVGVVLFVIWLIFRPNKIQVYVESASLAHFNLTNNNTTLNYDLALDVSVRNPNSRVGFYYDYVEARAIYDGSRFAFDTLPTFYQDHKNTTVLHPEFKGSAGALGSVAGTLGREKGEGSFYVDVKIYASVRLKLKFMKIGHFKPKYDCVVKLPVPSSKNAAGSFQRTKCDVDVF